MRILVIKPSSLGDVLHTFPSVALIRQSVPDIEYLDWVVNDSLADIVKLCDGVDRIIPYPRSRCYHWSALRPFIRELRQRPYDIVIDYQGLLRSALMSKTARHPVIWGFANAREGAPLFYDVRYRLSTLHQHALLKNLELTRAVFQLKATTDAPIQHLSISEELFQRARSLMASEATRPTLSVCFSSRWSSKNWSLSYIAQTLDELYALYGPYNCMLVGGKENAAEGNHLCGLVHSFRPVNLAGKTSLQELAAVLSLSRAMFTVDSGPMHIAASAGIPCVALFGATSPGLTGPFGPDGFHTVITTRCSQTPCMKKQCPRAIDCADGSSPAIAAQALFTLLSRK